MNSTSLSLQIEIPRTEGEVLITLSGNITRWEERFLDERFVYDLLQQPEQKLIVDLSGVNQIDSSGIQALYAWFSIVCKSGNEIRFVAANARASRLLRMTHLDTLLTFCPSIAYARKTFSPASGAPALRGIVTL